MPPSEQHVNASDRPSTHTFDDNAARQIGLANALGDVQFCAGYDTPLDETDERDLVAALRPIVEQRRDAQVRSMEGR